MLTNAVYAIIIITVSIGLSGNAKKQCITKQSDSGNTDFTVNEDTGAYYLGSIPLELNRRQSKNNDSQEYKIENPLKFILRNRSRRTESTSHKSKSQDWSTGEDDIIYLDVIGIAGKPNSYQAKDSQITETNLRECIDFQVILFGVKPHLIPKIIDSFKSNENVSISDLVETIRKKCKKSIEILAKNLRDVKKARNEGFVFRRAFSEPSLISTDQRNPNLQSGSDETSIVPPSGEASIMTEQRNSHQETIYDVTTINVGSDETEANTEVEPRMDYFHERLDKNYIPSTTLTSSIEQMGTYGITNQETTDDNGTRRDTTIYFDSNGTGNYVSGIATRSDSEVSVTTEKALNDISSEKMQETTDDNGARRDTTIYFNSNGTENYVSGIATRIATTSDSEVSITTEKPLRDISSEKIYEITTFKKYTTNNEEHLNEMTSIPTKTDIEEDQTELSKIRIDYNNSPSLDDVSIERSGRKYETGEIENLYEDYVTSTSPIIIHEEVAEKDVKIPKIISKELVNGSVISTLDGYETLPNKDFIEAADFTSEDYSNVQVNLDTTSEKKSELTGRLYLIFGDEKISTHLMQTSDGSINLSVDGTRLCDILLSKDYSDSIFLKKLCLCAKKQQNYQ